MTADDLPEANEMIGMFVRRSDLQPARGRLAWTPLAFTRRRISRPGQIRDRTCARRKYHSMRAAVRLKVGASPPHVRALTLAVFISQRRADVAKHEAGVRASVPQVNVGAEVAKCCAHGSERDGQLMSVTARDRRGQPQ